MGRTIKCFLEGEPPKCSKQQRKHRVIIPKHGKPFATTYKEKKVADAEESILAKFLPHKPDAPLEGPLSVSVTFCYARPKSHTKKQRCIAVKTTKPDIDNAVKLLLDAIAPVAFTDDSHIWGLCAYKLYATEYDQPGIHIRIEET